MKRTLSLAGLLAVSLIAAEPVKIVCLGDSITRGVRGGVTAEQTYEHHLQQWLTEDVTPVTVINKGIGGERTDQALKRLARDVVALQPDIVTIMYGTNDSAVDAGKTAPRLPIDTYEKNLHTIVQRLRGAGIRPVLMTSPPLCTSFVYMKRSPYSEKGANHQLVHYVRRMRIVAQKENVPLVDNFARWSEEALLGADLNALTTDGCHPNPAGHKLIARTLYPTLATMLGGAPTSTRADDTAVTATTATPVARTETKPEPGANIALHKPYTQSDPNAHGYGKGLTDGVIDSDSKNGVFASGKGTVYPKIVTVDLGTVTEMQRAVLRNSKDGSTKTVEIQLSSDDEAYDTVGTHVFGKRDGAVKTFIFAKQNARYVRLVFKDTWGNTTHGSPDFMFVREFEVYAE